MPPGPSVRVLLFPSERPIARGMIDWIADRQRHARVLIPRSLRHDALLPGRALYEPFATPGAAEEERASELAATLLGAGALRREVAEATILALSAGGAVICADTSLFRDLIPLSCWSMNLPERPTDGLLVQHLGIAGRLPPAWGDAGEEALEAILSGESHRIESLARARRLRARKDGPERFGRLARKSAGLRPGIVYLDLLASPAARTPEFGRHLGGLDRDRALPLLSVTAAVFI